MTKNKKDFSITTFTEIKTVTGQLIDIQCRDEDVGKIKELSELIYHINIPFTKEIKTISHGSFGRYSRFDIEQKKYAGGGCGYIECLKINNPPEKRNGNIIHECSSGNSVFYEFDTIENAEKVWEKTWARYADELIPKSEGFIRRVSCGWFSPWFYAVANQLLYGDFAFPERVGIDHPIYRPFNKFKLEREEYNSIKEDYVKKYDIKTCIGFNEEKVQHDYEIREYTKYTIYWDDGTFWSGSSLKDAPELVEKDKYKIIFKTNLCNFIKKRKYDRW